MDASQYKDYVLFMLFIKYLSNKYGDSDDFAPPVTIPKGAGFKDRIALKGDSDIGNKINTQIIQPLIDANSRVARMNMILHDFPTANILSGNTLFDPKFKDGEQDLHRIMDTFTRQADIAAFQQQIEELAEEHGGEGGLLEDAKNDKDKLTKASVAARRKELKSASSAPSHAGRCRMSPGFIPPHGGYENLHSYKKALIIFLATYYLSEKWVRRGSRTRDQMEQSARSGKQNIIEGSLASATSKQTEIHLTNVARASLGELLEDYKDLLRLRGLPIWEKDEPRMLALRTPHTEPGDRPVHESDASRLPRLSAQCWKE